MSLLLLALGSGAVALVYQVVWTRELALLAGSEVRALSVVVAAYFGGLALGARWLGPLADRITRPLRLYAGLELAAALLAAGGWLHLRSADVLDSTTALLVYGASVVLIATLPLGATLPALVSGTASTAEGAARSGGRLIAANTFGAVGGVAFAVLAIPRVGLSVTMAAALLSAVLVSAIAWAVARRRPVPGPSTRSQRVPLLLLGIAALVGFASLGFEMIATRLAALRLGSSLAAWGLVLGLFLAGLTLGYAAASGPASRTTRARDVLAALELAAAASVLLGLWILAPELVRTATGPSLDGLLRIAVAVLPATALFGAAFPFLVRLGLGEAVGAGWGALTAANTAGGIAGALIAPIVLLPALGPSGAGAVCAGVVACAGVMLLVGTDPHRTGLAGAGLGACALLALPLFRTPEAGGSARLLAAWHGAQASVAVRSERGHRTLIVDGDPEAATIGAARTTEELLAALPLLLHPNPRRFLEVGFGSGITLATATRFPLEALTCVELVPEVLEAAGWFAPANTAALSSDRVSIEVGDARVALARHAGGYDVVAANTVHPWSLGATGLYSREYFSRIATALRPGGLAVQWLPLHGLDAERLAAMLRTFFSVFPEGGVWWGANNLLLVGANAPLALPAPATIDARLEKAQLAPHRLGLRDGTELLARRIAWAADLRAVLGDAPLLVDDRPLLERVGGRTAAEPVLPLVLAIAEHASADDPTRAPIRLWLEAEVARAGGDVARADGRERLAETAGLAHAERKRAERRVTQAYAAMARGELDEAAQALRTALEEDPYQRDARFGLAGIHLNAGRPAAAAEELERLLADHPDDPAAWNELASARARAKDDAGARRALEGALRANPFYPEALANAGLLALARGDRAEAESMRRRLAELAPSVELDTLARALDDAGA